ncbi:MAG TPA: PBP1A family penicillin-binding protein [Thermoanaerobaculia bacterium]|nr:PBP1A family penicillin-binding protein [Thermoanaerobaculia bacterium]
MSEPATPLPAPRSRFRRRLAAWRRLLRTHPRLRRTLYGIGAGVALFMVVVVWLLFPYLRVFGDIGAGLENAPSRLYAVPEEIRVGEEIAPEDLARELEVQDYRSWDEDVLPAGRYHFDDDVLVVRLRRHETPKGPVPGQLVLVRFQKGRIVSLSTDGRPADSVSLEPPVLATYYDEEVREKWPVLVKELPEYVVQAVLAAEDDSFYWHPGVSPTGIARALMVDLRKGRAAQGGSTLTQQLVKNVFLTQDRRVFRKIREAVIALAVEAQHSKRSILQGYLNTIYLGGGGGLNYHGIGAAARGYFGKDATELTLPEAATIAGMIKSPAAYSPVGSPERSRKRRDEVLRRMAELKWIDAGALERALATPMATSPQRLGGRPAPHFADAMTAEARDRFGLKRLGNRGYNLFATLSIHEQGLAQKATSEVLQELDGPRRKGVDPLEAALISVDPHTGAILAYVGGRDFGRSEFDRVSQAHRQAGSSFKPIVLVTALESGRLSQSSILKDEPLTLKTGAGIWTPKNADGEFLGPVTVRKAVELSRNVPLIRLAMDVGLGKVAATAHRMGVDSDLVELPAMALGAADVTPREMATVYSTLANGGVRPVLHGLATVLGADGKPVPDLQPKKAERVISPQVAFITTSVLEGVVERGTARGVLRFGVPGPLAGKTGTTNEARDSWFAGYRPDRVTVVWVGRDNPGATSLSGSRAALPIWGRYMKASFKGVKSSEFPEPPGLEHATVCRDSGMLARPICPVPIADVFLPGQKPTQVCDWKHEPRFEEKQKQFGLRFSDWLKKKLQRILGKGREGGSSGGAPESSTPPD